MVINVTRNDIRVGQRNRFKQKNRCRECPVAVALKRTLNVIIEVGIASLFRYTPEYTKIKLPKKVKNFTTKSDGNYPIKELRPFSFTLTKSQLTQLGVTI